MQAVLKCLDAEVGSRVGDEALDRFGGLEGLPISRAPGSLGQNLPVSPGELELAVEWDHAIALILGQSGSGGPGGAEERHEAIEHRAGTAADLAVEIGHQAPLKTLRFEGGGDESLPAQIIEAGQRGDGGSQAIVEVLNTGPVPDRIPFSMRPESRVQRKGRGMAGRATGRRFVEGDGAHRAIPFPGNLGEPGIARVLEVMQADIHRQAWISVGGHGKPAGSEHIGRVVGVDP